MNDLYFDFGLDKVEYADGGRPFTSFDQKELKKKKEWYIGLML